MNQATADVIIGIAKGELGYTEESRPPKYPTNWTKYADEFAGPTQGQPWCAVFVSWVFDKAGLPLPAIQPAAIPSGFAYCPFAVSYARLHGQNVYDWRIGGWENIQPGDIVLFDWERNGSQSDHVGIVEWVDGSWIHTVEGNTSPSTGGSQSNGGGVYERERFRADVQCVWRPPVADVLSEPVGVPQTAPPANTVANPTLEVDDVKIVNQLIHVTHIGYGFGKGEADFGQPVSAVVGAVINGPDPKDLSDSWWEESKLANAARAQVSGNKVIVTVSGLAGDCDVYVTAVAA